MFMVLGFHGYFGCAVLFVLLISMLDCSLWIAGRILCVYCLFCDLVGCIT